MCLFSRISRHDTKLQLIQVPEGGEGGAAGGSEAAHDLRTRSSLHKPSSSRSRQEGRWIIAGSTIRADRATTAHQIGALTVAFALHVTFIIETKPTEEAEARRGASSLPQKNRTEHTRRARLPGYRGMRVPRTAEKGPADTASSRSAADRARRHLDVWAHRRVNR